MNRNMKPWMRVIILVLAGIMIIGAVALPFLR
jgi:hypothetical protein